MSAPSAEREAEFVVGGHVFSGAESEGAHGKIGLHVLPDDGLHPIAAERILGQHERRPARVALLARLEKPEQRALEIPLAQVAQHAVEHGGVQVVAAGVHHARVFGAPRQSRALLDGQRVDVGAQDDGPGPVAPPLDAGQDAGAGYRVPGDAGFGQCAADGFGRAALLEREFGAAVQFAAEFNGCHLCVFFGCQKSSRAIRMMLSALPMG